MGTESNKLIITSPYEEPRHHWEIRAGEWSLVEARRAAGYVKFNPKAQGGLSADTFVPLEAVNEIRRRVARWRAAEHPNATRVTRDLLEHWERLECPRLFFCQREAIETLIWLAEAPQEERQGLDVYGLQGDGSAFVRWCTKLCTGGGKTTVMAMLIAWHACNKEVYPQDARYCRHVLVVAPNLTVRERLAGLDPHAERNEYAAFGLVPQAYADALEKVKIRILNWQAMQWEDEAKLAKARTVDKRGPMSDKAYARAVLGPELARAPRLLVLNDEAHHAWRLPPKTTLKDFSVEAGEKEEATVWVGGLDRLHRAIGLLACHDFSATPFVPSGKMGKDDFLFKWIVSDFGLNDGIEAGLVKTPRLVSKTNAALDAKTYQPKLQDLYEALKVGLGSAQPTEAGLDPLLANAYALLASDWRATADRWREKGAEVPPVLISVVNNTTTAQRIERHFLKADALLAQSPELCDPERLLRIDSEALERTAKTGKASAKQEAETLRLKCNTVGKVGQPGEQVTNLVSVAMLSEGWDAKTVTHILGLRAFTSQLLCEQVIGRGLRRTSYDVGDDGLLTPEYVQVLGVPFRFLPVEGEGSGGTPPKPTFEIAVAPGREAAEIRWPNIVRIEERVEPTLTLREDLPVLTLAPDLISMAEMKASLGGWMKDDTAALIDLKAQPPRPQTLRFHIVRDLLHSAAYAPLRRTMTAQALFTRLMALVADFMASGKCRWDETLFWRNKRTDDPEALLAYAFALGKIVRHLLTHLVPDEQRALIAYVDSRHPTLTTARMPTWRTTREPFATGAKCQIAKAIYDSTWEAEVANAIACHPRVAAYVRNDRHVGLRIRYAWEGAQHDYIPDFVIRLKNGLTLVLEVKGLESEQTQAKHAALERWCRAVTNLQTYGTWCPLKLFNPTAIAQALSEATPPPS